jgi:hypothetical protein
VTAPTFLDNDVLWPTLKRLCRKTKRRSIVAVPYVGQGAARRLPLRKGDVLICALSLTNARSGSVCPAELKKFQKKGVRLFVRPNLHAKVYLFGEGAVVSSANISFSSEERLDESGMLVRDRSTVKKIKEWLRERMIDPLRKNWLDRCAKAYRPPRPSVGGEQGDRRRVWLVGTEPADFPESEKSAWKAGFEQAKRRLIERDGSYVESIRWTRQDGFRREVATEDRVIEIVDEDGKTVVYPHGAVLNVRRPKAALYVYIELPNRRQTIPWNEFRTASKLEGLRLPAKVTARAVPAAFADMLLRWTNLGT